MEAIEQRDGPLSKVRVLDLADEKASFCSRLLADMGAYVIKAEKPGGDPSRGIGPFLGNSLHPEKSLFFAYHNHNKFGITLNLEHPAGREIFLRLIKSADVVVETFSPGYLRKLGLGFDSLGKVNPRLILVSVTGFGQEGPRRKYKSCDLVASAFGGQMYVSGSPSTPPLKPFGELSYYAASLFAAVGILVALRKRAPSGQGEHLDISLQEAVVSTLDHVMVRYFYDKIISKRQGNRSWNGSSCILPCKEGYLHLTLSRQWETLVEWMAGEGMAEDLVEDKWKDGEYRLRNMDHVIEVLQRWTMTHYTHELFELGQLMHFPWAPIYSPEDVPDSPQLKARGFFNIPYKFSSFSPKWGKRAPLIGEDNAKIYQGELGLTDEELRRLSSMGVI